METLHAVVPTAKSSQAVTHVKDTVLMGNAPSDPQTSHNANVLLDGRGIVVKILPPIWTQNPVAAQLQ